MADVLALANGKPAVFNAITCPLCGAKVDVQDCTVSEEYAPGYHVAGTPLPRRERATVGAFCSGCEFVVDLRLPDGTPKSSRHLLLEVGRMVKEASA